MRTTNPIHPGEMLLEEFLVAMKKSQNSLASEPGRTPAKLNELIKRKREITAEPLDLGERGDHSSVHALVKIVQTEGELRRSTLIQKFSATAGKGVRTAEERIATALKEGRLQKRQDGLETVYYIPESGKEVPQKTR